MSIKLSRAFALTLALTFILASPGMASRKGLPPGTYTTTITEADIPSSVTPQQIPVLVGQWEIEFSEAGSLIVSKNNDIVVVARYTSGPAQMVLRDLEGPLACLFPGGATGVYEWTFGNDLLSLSAIQDRCVVGRMVVLTAHAWQKE